MTVVAVPFVDLGLQHAPLAAGIIKDIDDLLESGTFVNGPQVEAFEGSFASFCGQRFCIGVSSGLDALRLALIAAGINPGDGVVVPANTFIATFEAVTQAGGLPVVVDVTESDYNIDPVAVAAALQPNIRFLLPVDLFGQLADMIALEKLARKHDLFILEDACQAHGASRDGLAAGAVANATAFSFYPAKNLGAIGDAGAIITDDENLARTIRALRQHGETEKYHSEQRGYTARLDTLQALVLHHKLPHLREWNLQRQQAASYYSTELAGIGDLRLPSVAPRSDPVWHLYVIRTREPDRLAEYLRERGIATARHYPELPHLSAAYADLDLPLGSFPIAESISREGLSLPLFPGITQTQLALVCDTIRDFFDRG